jgi:ABC-type multidrug transport system fused ATPase/permease subunit
MSTISKADWIYCLEWLNISSCWNHKSLLMEWNNAYARFYKAQIMHENVM